MAANKKISIMLLIDKEKNKVLFAESDKDFVEFLFSFLTLPIGTIISLANKESNLECMDTLYKSVESLDKKYLQTEFCREMLLKPRSASEFENKSLSLQFDSSTDEAPVYYRCPTWTCHTETHCLVRMFRNAKCLCGLEMNKDIFLELSSIDKNRGFGTFLNGIGKFMISDHLEVRTVSDCTSLSILCGFGIKDGTALEEKIVSVGIDEHQEAPSKVDDFVSSVEKAFDMFPSEDLNNVFLTLQSCMVEILKNFGGNCYRIPHMNKKKLIRNEQLPLCIELDPNVLSEATSAVSRRQDLGE